MPSKSRNLRSTNSLSDKAGDGCHWRRRPSLGTKLTAPSFSAHARHDTRTPVGASRCCDRERPEAASRANRECGSSLRHLQAGGQGGGLSGRTNTDRGYCAVGNGAPGASLRFFLFREGGLRFAAKKCVRGVLLRTFIDRALTSSELSTASSCQVLDER
jgi:hypothetical protein